MLKRLALVALAALWLAPVRADFSGPLSLSQLGNLNTFAMIGTSRESQQYSYGNTGWQYFNWANYLDGHKYQLVYNAGCSGQTTRVFIAGTGCATIIGPNYGIGLYGALGSKARFVVIGGIVNDPASYTGDQIWSNAVIGAEPGTGILQAAQQIIGNGQIPVITLEYGQNTLTNVAGKITQILRYNQIAREFCATGQAICLDFPSAIWNPTSTTGSLITFVANSSQDNTHSNYLGGYLLGQVFDSALKNLVPPLNNLPDSLADSNITNGLFVTQTGGTSSGAGTLTGNVPSGWTLTLPTGVTATSSFVSDPAGFGYDWQLVIANASGAAQIGTIYAQANSSLTAAASLVYNAGGYVTTAAGSSGFIGTEASAQLFWSGGNNSALDFGIQSITNNTATTAAYVETLVTAPPSTPTPATGYGSNPVILSFFPGFSANGSATITIARPWVQNAQ
jgi:hypothetical protein